MQITAIRLKNWKNFRSVEVALSERIFIVGANALGKSNFLDAFRFLRDIVKEGGGLQSAISARGGMSKIRCLSARKSPHVQICVEMKDDDNNNWKYEIEIKQEPRGTHSPYLGYEKVYRNNEPIVVRPNEEDKSDQVRLSQTFLEQVNTNKEFREIGRFFEKTLYLHLVPQLLKYPQAFSGDDLPGDPFGRGFLDRLATTPKKQRDSRLSKIGKALVCAVPKMENLHYEEENGKPHLEARCVHWRPDAGKQKEDQFSDGTLRLIALLWALLEGDGLLLLEEPELSLNSAIIQRLPSIIYNIQKKKKRQVFLTTHSSDLLQEEVSMNDILLLKYENEDTQIIKPNDVENIRLLLEGGASLADAVMPSTTPPEIKNLLLFED